MAHSRPYPSDAENHGPKCNSADLLHFPALHLALRDEAPYAAISVMLRRGQFGMQPGAGGVPVVDHGPARDAKGLSGLLHTESAEEAELDHLGGPGRDLRQRIERIFEGEHVEGPSRRCGIVGERHFPAHAALLRAAGARGIDDRVPHHARHGGKKMRAVLPVHSAPVEQAQIRLLHELGRLPAAGLLSREQPARNLPQLLLHERRELGERLLIPRAPGLKQQRQILLAVHRRAVYLSRRVPNRRLTMGDERWQVLSDWLGEWLEADPRARVRLRDELAADHPELVDEADRISSSADSLTGFLETPALVLAARELVVDAPVLPPGATVGPYRVVQLLARGGMGDVYRATDSRLGRDVALKVLSPGRTSDPRRVERFLMEARITASLDHPNIVRVYDVGRVDEQSYLVAELLEGETLRARIARGRIGPDEARRIALEVARGLAAAHVAGLVHRDLKPENIFLTRNGETKLLDFGIAKLTQDDAVPDGVSTLTGVVLGTAGYLAPEQIRGDTVDGRADLFAFGAVLFEMVSGTRAFVRDQIVDTLHAILHDPPPVVLEDVPGVPLSLATIVGRLLEKAPAARFQSATELIAALERADVGRTRSWPVRQIARMRAGLRRPVWKAAATAVVVAAVWAGVLVWNEWSLPAINSIAVLPFDNISLDPEIDYIAGGMTDGLIDRLSRAQSLTVMARGTVMRFKREKDPLKAAQKLGVGAVVRGEVSRRGTRIVISAELIEGATGERLWGDTFDRPEADLVSVQDSIVLSIAEGLRLRLSREQKARLGGSGTNNSEAYELFLRGRVLLQHETEEDDLEARKLFIEATEIDPNFLNAHLAVASTYARSIGSGYAPPREAVHAHAALEKAAAIDPNNVAVRATRAHLRLTTTATHAWAATEREYRAVLDEPALLRSLVYHPMSLFFVAIGKTDEAVELVKRALVVDPGNLETRVMLGNYLLQAGHLDDALREYTAISAEVPEAPAPLFGIADVYKRHPNFPRAAQARRNAHELAGEEDAARAFTGVTTEAGYRKAEITVAWAQLRQLEELAPRRYVSPFNIARLHAQVGNREQALALLEQASKDGGPVGLMLLRVDPAWDSVRADPRFTVVVRRLGIP